MKQSYTSEEMAEKPISSTFKLQCQEFDVDHTPHQAIAEKCESLGKTVINSLKSAKFKHKLNFQDVSFWGKHGIQFPLGHINSIIQRTPCTEPDYTWIKPQDFVSVRSQRLHGKVFQRIYVEIPEAVFGKRDFVNVVYPTKRAHYICSCICAIKASLKSCEISFKSGANQDLIFPNLIVKDKKENLSVWLIFVAPSLAKPSRFALSTGSIRPTTILENYHKKTDVLTPRYNQKALRSLLEHSLVTEIESQITSQNTLNQALNLLTAWFKCRELETFDELFVASYMLHLLKTSVINDKQDTLVIFRNVLKALRLWDVATAITLKDEENTETDNSEYLKVFDIVLLDPTGYWNIASDISFDDLNKAKSLIKLSLPAIGDHHSFDKLFIDTQKFSNSYDHYYKLYLSTNDFEHAVKQFLEDVVDWKDRLNAFVAHFIKILRTAMGERYEYMHVTSEFVAKTWLVTEMKSTMPVDIYLVFGFRIRKQWQSPLTVGPVANDPSAQEFRDFWGKASQLRKFADTRICECTVWGETPSDAVVLSILKFLLSQKFGLPERIISWRSALSDNLRSDKASYDKLDAAFNSLSSVLRNLKNLPLMITNIHGVSPYLRYSEPDAADMFSSQWGSLQGGYRVPQKNRIPKYVPSIPILVKLEYSGKWGQDFEGIRRLTAAFYIKIAEQLERYKLIAVPTLDELYVVQDNIVFKITIVHDKIKKMLEAEKKKLIASGSSRIETSAIGKQYREFEKKYVSEAVLSASIQSFGRKYTVFPETVQLVKRWLASHLLSGYINDFALEMIVCAAIQDITVEVPLSTFAAFKRVLNLLSTHPWANCPLVLDYDEAWSEDQLAEIERTFVKMRPVLPPMVIITNQDTMGSKWTFNGPNPVILKRIVVIAQSCLRILDENLGEAEAVDIKKSLLSPNTSAYDAIVKFHPKSISRMLDQPAADQKRGLPVVDFDPLTDLVETLKGHFGTVAMFFYNKYRGEEVYIKFKPHQEIKEPTISKCTLQKVVDDHLELNKDEVYEGIKIIGKGLVKDILVL